ncbi:heavy metal translocating P-type ATPase [uncultured Fusobacterium sp.]|uniref:heavy metal translocating P-type ATPase n=1 Tax=uncultured Fusobacterium sp. TaxID=159267 RepID=UPI0025CDBE0D|nr:heavy metal translocating P-type ATPase [uncultured Fusobacterium sp.]
MKKVEYEVKNLDCAGCAGKIQYKAGTMKGVFNANLDLYKKRFILEVDEDFEEDSFLSTINIFANSIEPGTEIVKLEEYNEEEELKRREEERKKEELEEKKEKITIIIGLILFLMAIILGRISYNLRIILAVIAYVILGWDVVLKSFKNILKGNFMDENFLMTIATFGAFYLGESTEAVGVMLFYKIGEYFQDKAVSNSRKSIEKLLDIRPEYANIKNKDGELVKVSPKKLKIGDIIVVKAGEKIPVDGIVIKGNSTLNTAALTGESLPIEVDVDSEILSGSLNGAGTLEIKVTKLFADSTINKIISMVENASNKKAESEKFITKFARYYTPIVVISAIIVGVFLPLILGDFNLWFGRALIFLVISCPCALVLSVPLTFFSSIGIASKQGILIKGGNYLEALTSVGSVVFDKTGTLTKGKFKIDSLEAINCSEEELLKIAQIGEYYSNHPIGKTILSQLNSEIDEDYMEGYKELSGFGVVAYYEGKEILVGNYKLMKEYEVVVEEKEYAGTIIYTALDREFLGYIYISDEIKSDSKETILELSKNGIDSYMLTGDNKKIGEMVGEKLGIKKENIFTQLLPQGKVNQLQSILDNSNKKVIFVGDGVNDAPVLSMADIGIAMGGVGSDIAVETADIVIMKDEPSKIIEVLKIANINKKVVIQNIVFALGIKILVMILGVFGIANMWMAIFSDVGVSLLAVLNASWGVKRYFK